MPAKGPSAPALFFLGLYARKGLRTGREGGKVVVSDNAVSQPLSEPAPFAIPKHFSEMATSTRQLAYEVSGTACGNAVVNAIENRNP
jgi:hypothetical protein